MGTNKNKTKVVSPFGSLLESPKSKRAHGTEMYCGDIRGWSKPVSTLKR